MLDFKKHKKEPKQNKNVRNENNELLFVQTSRIPEANIQAEIYHQCKLNNIECFLEYKLEHSKFDIIIIKNGIIKVIIEVKSY